MFDKLRRVRLRPLLAGGAAVLTAFGVAQAVDTSAAATDAVTATSGNITAAGDLLPAVAPADYGCWNDSYGLEQGGAVIWFRPVEPYNSNFTYRLTVTQLNGTVVETRDLTPGPGDTLDIWVDKNMVGGHTGWDYIVRLYTVNPAGELSTEYRGTKVHQKYDNYTYCDGDASGANLQYAALARAPQKSTATSAPTSTAPVTTAPVTTAPTSSAPVTTAPTTAAEPTATRTGTPSATAPESTTRSQPTTTTAATRVISGPFALGGDSGLAAQIVSDGGTRRVVVLDSGAEVCRTVPAIRASERILDTGNGTLLISGAGAVRQVDTATCAISSH
ncbi:hypothetical protein [Tomitella cavernea]|uniref:Uncharacterized protein n=1 Tax=Tomitella cavernea TaxID=1387982 RepID=A0ABP9CCM5_9ACTN|nr:hypothetical protein [Tomitella cavernea]